MQGGAAIAELSPIVIPVFVSNLGCPHRCIFCDQGRFSPPVSPDEVAPMARAFIAGCRNPGQRRRVLAFYGGSFTGIEPALFERYLDAARSLVREGIVHGIKASTRPDMITEDKVALCRDAGFVELEIGAQSMDDAVLLASGRGHGSYDTVKASEIIRASGLELVIQIMPGLPGEDRQSFRHTVKEVERLDPGGVRMYPTVVLAGTALERLYDKGGYRPLDLDEAVLRCLYGYVRFSRKGITVLRMGLPPSENLRVVAGPSHPAFGFLVKARAYRIMTGLLMERHGRRLEFTIHPDDISELLGYKGENVKNLGFSYSFSARLPRGYVEYMQCDGGAERGCLQPKDIIEYIL